MTVFGLIAFIFEIWGVIFVFWGIVNEDVLVEYEKKIGRIMRQKRSANNGRNKCNN